MPNKRLWIALMAIPICLASLLIIGAQRSHLARADGVIDPTCSNPGGPCIEYKNTNTGQGVEGFGMLGTGLLGVTIFNSTSSSNGKAGVSGNDLSTSGAFDSGVRGVSVRGLGVSGTSSSGAGPTTSRGAAGVRGNSTNGDGVQGISSAGVGVFGASSKNNGVFGDSQAPGASGVYGQNDGGGFGVAGRITKPGIAAVFADAGTTRSVALTAQSLLGVGANIVGGAINGGVPFPALSVVGNDTSGDLIDACATQNPCDQTHAVFRVDISGDALAAVGLDVGGALGVRVGGAAVPSRFGSIDVSGDYEKSASCVAGCSAATATSSGRAVVSYVATQSMPSIDDFGEAMLVNGSTYVRIDNAFANVVDHSANYLVFITPEGDSRGLYVTQKSARGFSVRENLGGHSTLAFSYRIVAKPFGSREQRLPMVTVPKIPTHRLLSPGYPVPR